jgi:cytochrome c oxidase assembly factor 3
MLSMRSGADYLRSMPQSSYYDKQNRPTAALYRARQPYLAKNIMAGLALLGFVGGVCMWTVNCISNEPSS